VYFSEWVFNGRPSFHEGKLARWVVEETGGRLATIKLLKRRILSSEGSQNPEGGFWGGETSKGMKEKKAHELRAAVNMVKLGRAEKEG